jgi:hypothetical protein
MADELIHLSDERRRRQPLVSEQEAALASEYARAYVAAVSATEKRFETAMLNVGFDLPTLGRVKAAYEALKNPDPERPAHGEPVQG